MRGWRILAAVWLLAGPVGAAQVYRCEDAAGAISYQQVPCAGSGGEVDLPAPAARWEGLRPGERELLEDYRRRDARPPRRAPAAKDRSRASARTCWSKRQRLERVAARLRRGYRRAEGERLRRSRDELDGFLRRYCD